jgi:outer membrane receptor protein involved in Fe transport
MLLDTTSNNSTVRFGQGSNTIVNASARYAWSKTMELFASVENLFNREYTESPYAFNQPFNQVLSMPRFVNAGVRVRF